MLMNSALFTLLLTSCMILMSSASKPQLEVGSLIDEHGGEEVFQEFLGPVMDSLTPEELELFHQGAKMQEMLEPLLEKAGPSIRTSYRQAIEQFMWEEAPLSTTHSTLNEIIRTLDDVELQAEFSSFLDAPLETAEDEEKSRAALCKIIGIYETMKRAPNAAEISHRGMAILGMIEEIWGSDPPKMKAVFKKYTSFLFTRPEEGGEPASALKDLISIVSDQTDFAKELEELYEIMYSKTI